MTNDDRAAIPRRADLEHKVFEIARGFSLVVEPDRIAKHPFTLITPNGDLGLTVSAANELFNALRSGIEYVAWMNDAEAMRNLRSTSQNITINNEAAKKEADDA